jgi:Kef-type K+ transport system membrane component KefB
MFALLVAATALLVSLVAKSRRLHMVLTRLQDSTAEIRVRAAVVLLVGFVALASRFGLETILGAFMAGAVVGIVDRDTTSHPHFRLKLEAMGYGFLIPVFFVTSGLRLDLSGLVANPSALARVPILVLALLAVRGLPALLFRRMLTAPLVLTAGLLQATSLPFIVTATQIGVLTGLMSAVTAAALVCAGLVSVIAFPAVALVLVRATRSSGTSHEPVPVVEERAQPGG